jgi:hypothetical protein
MTTNLAPVMSENLAETLRRTTVVIEKVAKSLARRRMLLA